MTFFRRQDTSINNGMPHGTLLLTDATPGKMKLISIRVTHFYCYLHV